MYTCLLVLKKFPGILPRTPEQERGGEARVNPSPNFWHESPPLACESIVKRCTIAFYNSEMHIWLHMLQLNLCRSRYYWLLAKGHGKIHDGHGKVMEKSWNLICQILWEPWYGDLNQFPACSKSNTFRWNRFIDIIVEVSHTIARGRPSHYWFDYR